MELGAQSAGEGCWALSPSFREPRQSDSTRYNTKKTVPSSRVFQSCRGLKRKIPEMKTRKSLTIDWCLFGCFSGKKNSKQPQHSVALMETEHSKHMINELVCGEWYDYLSPHQ